MNISCGFNMLSTLSLKKLARDTKEVPKGQLTPFRRAQFSRERNVNVIEKANTKKEKEINFRICTCSLNVYTFHQ